MSILPKFFFSTVMVLLTPLIVPAAVAFFSFSAFLSFACIPIIFILSTLFVARYFIVSFFIALKECIETCGSKLHFKRCFETGAATIPKSKAQETRRDSFDFVSSDSKTTTCFPDTNSFPSSKILTSLHSSPKNLHRSSSPFYKNFGNTTRDPITTSLSCSPPLSTKSYTSFPVDCLPIPYSSLENYLDAQLDNTFMSIKPTNGVKVKIPNPSASPKRSIMMDKSNNSSGKLKSVRFKESSTEEFTELSDKWSCGFTYGFYNEMRLGLSRQNRTQKRSEAGR